MRSYSRASPEAPRSPFNVLPPAAIHRVRPIDWRIPSSAPINGRGPVHDDDNRPGRGECRIPLWGRQDNQMLRGMDSVAATCRHDPSLGQFNAPQWDDVVITVPISSGTSLNDVAVTSARFPATGATRSLTRSIPLCKQTSLTRRPSSSMRSIKQCSRLSTKWLRISNCSFFYCWPNI